MDQIGQILKKIVPGVQNTTELGKPSKLDEYWAKKRVEAEESEKIRQDAFTKQRKFWKENPTLQVEESTVSNIIERQLGKKFSGANLDQIEQKIKDLIEPFFLGSGIYMWGRPGTGKTHLCAVLIREYYRRNPKKISWTEEENEEFRSAYYFDPPKPSMITVPDLLAKIKASFGKKDEEKDEPIDALIIKDLQEKKILFLDDIGTEKTTDWSLQTIYQIIDVRYRQERQTVFTSNLSLNELSDRTSDRITSRIAEMCKVIELKGKDRRIKK